MREGYSGLKIAESKEEAADIFRECFDGEINIPDLEEFGISDRSIYNNFSGVEEAESFSFGNRDYKCSICNKVFEERASWKAHKSNCSEEIYSEKLEAEKFLSDFNTDSKFITYILKIRRFDGDEFYYVGTTKNPIQRMIHHMRREDISLPKADEFGYSKDVEFDIISVLEVHNFKTKEEAMEKERVRALEIAIEKETTNVVGGR